jgi:sterol desaturase/sphingolipid hydroxylase (fatty acid hydroxylase superfamily)
MDSVAMTAFSFIGGLFAWTFLEYLIHAWLSHRFQTVASPFHQAHHKDPRRVFAIRAWLPVGASWIAGMAAWGLAPAMVFYSGVITGFALYELVHYRVHFRTPHNRLEAYLRERHLVHHYRAPDRCFGVTNALWDHLFASEIADAEMRSLREAVKPTPPFAGPTNVRMLFRFGSLER